MCVKAPVHYWHNALHGGSHSDGMSAIGPFCVVHTQVHQVWSMSLTSSPTSSPISPGCQGVSSLRAHSQPVPRGGTQQPRQGVLCEETYTPGLLESRTTHPYMLLDGEWCHMLLTGLIYMGTCRWSDSGHMQVT